jgi:hypothetical protein
MSQRTPEKAKTYLEEIAADIANKSPQLLEQGADVLSDTFNIIARCFKINDKGQVSSSAKTNLFVSGLAMFLFQNEPERDEVVNVFMDSDAFQIIKEVQKGGACRKDAIPAFVTYMERRMNARNKRFAA